MPSNPRTRLGSVPACADLPAIRDIHGRLDLLRQAEQAIFEDASRLPGRKLIITLSDYIDRRPASAQVISHLMQPVPDSSIASA